MPFKLTVLPSRFEALPLFFEQVAIADGSRLDKLRARKYLSPMDNAPQCDSGAQALAAHKDEIWMQQALELAAQAAQIGEIPVGALIVHDGAVVAAAFNRKEERQNSLAHAEILAIEEASRALGRWRLTGCTLYVTLEPCLMCSGAIVQARLDRVVYATADLKAGAVHSLYQTLSDARLNHSPLLTVGVLQAEASAQLSGFFRELRENKKILSKARGSEAR
jgi:tRNA(adenine34) deaminase